MGFEVPYHPTHPCFIPFFRSANHHRRCCARKEKKHLTWHFHLMFQQKSGNMWMNYNQLHSLQSPEKLGHWKKTATPIQFPSFQWHRDGFGCSKWSRNKGSTTSHHIPPFAQTFHGGPVGSMLNLEPSGQACAVHLFYYKGRGQLFELDAWHSTELRLFQVGGNGSNMIFVCFFFFFFAWSGLCQETSWIHGWYCTIGIGDAIYLPSGQEHHIFFDKWTCNK